jgi:outer membrane protein TolC
MMRFDAEHPLVMYEGRQPHNCTLRARNRAITLLASATLLGGCESYHPAPASDEAIAAALTPMESPELARAAAELKHPLLPPVSVGEDGSLTPQGAAVVAVLQNPSLRATRSRRGVAEAQLLQAGILPNPQLAAALDFPSFGDTQDTVTAYSLGLTWDVTSLIPRGALQEAARQEVRSVQLDIAWQEWQAAMGAKLHATRIFWLSQQRDELARQVDEAAKLESRASDNLHAGLVTVIDSAAAAATTQKRRASLLTTESSLVSESAALHEALGLPADAKVRIVAETEEPAPPLPSAQDVDDAVNHCRLDIAALQAGYASQEAKLHGAVLSQFPKIGLGITRARDTSNVGTIGFGITLDLPIFDRGQGRIAIEKATRQQLFDELVARTFEAHADARRALEELAAAGPQVTASQKTAEKLDSLAKALNESRARGDADIVQQAQARNDAADAIVDSLRIRQQEAELRIALEVATGRLLGGFQR